MAFILFVAVKSFGAIVHPVPDDFGGTEEENARDVARFPAWVLAAVVPAWVLTVFASSWIAGCLSGRISALCVGLLLLAAAIFNLAMLPYPIWFKAVNLIAIPLAIALAVYQLSGAKLSAIQFSVPSVT